MIFSFVILNKMTTYQRLIQRGFEEGMEMGIKRQKVLTVRKMLSINIPTTEIAKILELPEAEVTRLLMSKL